MKNRLSALLLAATAGATVCLGARQREAKPYKIYLSMSYIGNDWQAEAANMVKAMAASMGPDKVSLEVQVSGPNAQRQIQQLNAMVQAGANAIVVYPISPTALNQVIKNACEKGVVVVAYDSIVTEPCAYNTTIDQDAAGRKPAEWLVEQLKGKGNIIMITGVPGTSVDTARTAAARDVFSKHSGIHVLAEGNGMWSQAVARSELSKIVATHPWKDIDGIWVQAGCYTVASMEDEAGIADKDKKPCAGEGSNGHRIQMLKSAEGVEAASGTYRPMGLSKHLVCVAAVFGGTRFEACRGDFGRQKGLAASCTRCRFRSTQAIRSSFARKELGRKWLRDAMSFQPQIIANPGWFASIYSPDTPEVGLNAALVGTPEATH